MGRFGLFCWVSGVLLVLVACGESPRDYRRVWWYPTFVESGYLNWWCFGYNGGGCYDFDCRPAGANH